MSRYKDLSSVLRAWESFLEKLGELEEPERGYVLVRVKADLEDK